ncbi:MAG: glycosyltransferase 61 family protein [Paracoccaceae bacterium]
MFSASPLVSKLRRVLTKDASDFFAGAEEKWTISPAEEISFPAAIMPAGHKDRVIATEFGRFDEVMLSLTEPSHGTVGATIGYRFRDVDYVDGVLYHKGAELHLRQRQSRLPVYRRPQREISGALYESWVGNRWFGNWLMDDCLTYQLAAQSDKLVTSRYAEGHVPRYEELQNMKPIRIGDANFNELILFDDRHNNSNRKARAAAQRTMLAAGRDTSSTPGVFLLRGTTGDHRRLLNEMDLAERLSARYGIRFMLAEDYTTDELLDACAGAKLVIGVEGSQLVHGLAVMPAGGALITLQPPDRVTTALKLMCDRLDLRFCALIGEGSTEGFTIDANDVDAVLDMIQ